MLALTTVVATGSPAFAAVPGNDTLSGLRVVGVLPFSETVDTSEATTDADDTELNAACDAPALDASVWYSVQFDGSCNGGQLSITVGVAPPPPDISLTVNPVGTFNNKTGTATVKGTVTCAGPSDFAFVYVLLSQSIGRYIIRGTSGIEVTCDTVVRPWSVEVLGDNGRFAGGKALSVTDAFACGRFVCSDDFQEHTIHLRGSRR